MDNNGNGQRDPGETPYLDQLDLLVTIDHESLETYQPYRQNDHIAVAIAPGVHRLDLDPAGFPLDYQASEQALAVEVSPGEYTQVLIPLKRAFSLSGVVTDSDGNALAGQQVNAVDVDTEYRKLSIANGAGVFYLEGLLPGSYRFELSERAVEQVTVDLNSTAEPFQEINFRILPDGIKPQRLNIDLSQTRP